MYSGLTINRCQHAGTIAPMTSPPDKKDKQPSTEPFVADFSEGLETGLYLALLELLDEGLIITGDETVIEANSAACRLLERDYRQIAGKPLANLFPSERAFLDARARLFIQGEMRGMLQVSLPGGRHRDLRFIAAARLRPGIHALILSPDLVAEAYGQRPPADNLWPRLAAALEQPVIVIDEHDVVVAANAVALSLLKVSRAELVDHPVDTCMAIEWPAIGATPIAHLHCHNRPEAGMLAKVLPGPKPGWRVLILPPAACDAAPLAAPAPPEPMATIPGDYAAHVTDAARHAIERNLLSVHFQPLIDARGGAIRGGEALLRWRHPDLGVIPYAQFKHLAHELRLIAPMGNWILKTACSRAATWPGVSGKPAELTVNVATEQVLDGDFAERVRLVLAETGFPASRLELDLDEQILNDDSPGVLATLQALRQLGVRLALDDFGRGAAPLPKLKRYPIQALKLDPTLVAEVGHDEASEAIVEAITCMAGVLGLEVLARGVESEAQQAFLSALGCHMQQGPLFGPTRSAAAFRTLLESPTRPR